MLRVYIIRHAQSANNALADQSQRHYDPPLTLLGNEQAERLAQHLAAGDSRDMEVDIRSGYSVQMNTSGFGITHLYTSAMYRALQTTQQIARALDMRPDIWLDIHEEGGVYLEESGTRHGKAGKTRAEIEREFPTFQMPDEIGDEGWWGAARGYETRADAFTRAGRVATELRNRVKSDDVLALITHGTFSDRLLKALLNQTDSSGYYYMQYNTGITRVEFLDSMRVLVRYTNRIDHLSPDMMS